jgi:hypothetical protein
MLRALGGTKNEERKSNWLCLRKGVGCGNET